MRIGQFTDTFYPVVDGVGRVVYNYASHLPHMGHECYVVAPMVETGYRGGFPFELVDFRGKPVPGAPQYRAGIPWLDAHYHARMENIELDIIHAHAPFSAGQEALRLVAKRDIPLVATFHSKYYDDFYKATGMETLANLGVRYVVEFYERCDEVWAVSQSSADVLHSYGYEGEIAVMENGTDLRPCRAEDRRAAEERFGLSGDEPVLLFVGQMNWKKNILHILEAAALLQKGGAAFRLVLAGQGPDAEAIRSKAAELGLAGRTVFTGHITDSALLDGLYQRATLFVFPSIYDNAPMVLREAAAMGTPAVLTRGSCAAEIVEDGVNGLLAGDTAEELAAVLRAGLADAERLHALGSAAQQTIPTPWEDILKHAVARYEALIARNERGELKHRHADLRRFIAERTRELQKQYETLKRD